MRSLRKTQTWFGEDEVTSEVYLLGALIKRPVVTVMESAPLAHLQEILLDDRVPAIAVIDGAHTLRGLVTRTGVLRALRDTPEATAGSMVSAQVYTIPIDSTVEAAAALIAVENIGQLVVIDDAGDLLGIVSAIDIARHVAMRAGYLS